MGGACILDHCLFCRSHSAMSTEMARAGLLGSFNSSFCSSCCRNVPPLWSRNCRKELPMAYHASVNMGRSIIDSKASQRARGETLAFMKHITGAPHKPLWLVWGTFGGEPSIASQGDRLQFTMRRKIARPMTCPRFLDIAVGMKCCSKGAKSRSQSRSNPGSREM